MAVDRTTFRKCQSGGLTLIMIIMKYIKLLYSSYVMFPIHHHHHHRPQELQSKESKGVEEFYFNYYCTHLHVLRKRMDATVKEVETLLRVVILFFGILR